jgi:probable rRNA maturation factor
MLKTFGQTFEIDERALMRCAKEAFLYLKRDFEVNLRFVSASKITELNRIYRNRNLATDVLSFRLDKDAEGGDIVICYKEARRQAIKGHADITAAASLLLVHGLLHLAGFEHTKSEDRVKMEKAEENILRKARVKIEG